MAQTGYTPILIYSSSTTTNAPAVGNLTNSTLGSELAINITDGKLFFKDNANAIQVIAWKVTPTTAGGTGLTSYTAGDLLYYATGTTLSKLGIGAANTVLTSTATAPQWSSSLTLTTLTLSDNLVIATSGKGIDFSATPGTGTSELLADYEEGTWTATMVPSTSGTITLSNNGGTYTKIGRTVTINAALKVSSVSSPVGYFTINGLPFSGGAGASFRCSISILGDAMEITMTTSITASMQSGTILYVFKYNGTGSQANCAQDVKANSEFFIGGTYTT